MEVEVDGSVALALGLGLGGRRSEGEGSSPLIVREGRASVRVEWMYWGG